MDLPYPGVLIRLGSRCKPPQHLGRPLSDSRGRCCLTHHWQWKCEHYDPRLRHKLLADVEIKSGIPFQKGRAAFYRSAFFAQIRGLHFLTEFCTVAPYVKLQTE